MFSDSDNTHHTRSHSGSVGGSSYIRGSKAREEPLELRRVLQHHLMVGIYRHLIAPCWRVASPFFLPLATFGIIYSCGMSLRNFFGKTNPSMNIDDFIVAGSQIFCATVAVTSSFILTVHASGRINPSTLLTYTLVSPWSLSKWTCRYVWQIVWPFVQICSYAMIGSSLGGVRAVRCDRTGDVLEVRELYDVVQGGRKKKSKKKKRLTGAFATERLIAAPVVRDEITAPRVIRSRWRTIIDDDSSGESSNIDTPPMDIDLRSLIQ